MVPVKSLLEEGVGDGGRHGGALGHQHSLRPPQPTSHHLKNIKSIEKGKKFIHSKGRHHSNTRQFPENVSLIVHFPSYVLQKENQNAKHTSLVRCAELGWEETGSVKEVGRERPDIMTHKYTASDIFISFNSKDYPKFGFCFF